MTITMSGGSVSGLAVLSQYGPTVTGMLGPALTDVFPSRTWEGDTMIILARPRTGRHHGVYEVRVDGTSERMTGTIDANKGTIEFVRKEREGK